MGLINSNFSHLKTMCSTISEVKTFVSKASLGYKRYFISFLFNSLKQIFKKKYVIKKGNVTRFGARVCVSVKSVTYHLNGPLLKISN